jgi:hypothetical protein
MALARRMAYQVFGVLGLLMRLGSRWC